MTENLNMSQKKQRSPERPQSFLQKISTKKVPLASKKDWLTPSKIFKTENVSLVVTRQAKISQQKTDPCMAGQRKNIISTLTR